MSKEFPYVFYEDDLCIIVEAVMAYLTIEYVLHFGNGIYFNECSKSKFLLQQWQCCQCMKVNIVIEHLIDMELKMTIFLY